MFPLVNFIFPPADVKEDESTNNDREKIMTFLFSTVIEVFNNFQTYCILLIQISPSQKKTISLVMVHYSRSDDF